MILLLLTRSIFSYAYVDVPVTCGIRRAVRRGIRYILQTYDVICRWGIYYIIRISNEEYALIEDNEFDGVTLRYAIPSMHIESHEAACAILFGLKLMDSVGRHYGEGVEHPWARFNKLRPQVREMGWGSRRDFMNDHIRNWNWEKTLKLGVWGFSYFFLANG